MSRIKIIIIVSVISAAFFSCGDKFKPATEETESENSPSQESWNSTVVFSDSGNVKAVLTAGHISVFTAKGYTLIDSGAKVEFYREGKIVSVLTGMNGKIDDATKNIEITDSVTVVNSEGSRLITEKLLWKNDEQKVYSDLFVRITTPEEIIEGTGFESDQNLSNYKIYKVSGVFNNK
ncbi:MAG: LPS export ABC transporter periplasmic protein LptC [Ignavibacteria bacterium]|nr:LPS export ABC transporter periplasmic protein LptC [Ignavibacteria bacterium]